MIHESIQVHKAACSCGAVWGTRAQALACDSWRWAHCVCLCLGVGSCLKPVFQHLCTNKNKHEVSARVATLYSEPPYSMTLH